VAPIRVDEYRLFQPSTPSASPGAGVASGTGAALDGSVSTSGGATNASAGAATSSGAAYAASVDSFSGSLPTIDHGDDIAGDQSRVGWRGAGVSLGDMAASAGFTISSPGTYSLLDVAGTIVVAQDVHPVVIDRCRVVASSANNNGILCLGRSSGTPSAGDVVIQHCEVDCSSKGDVAVAGDLGGFSIIRCDLHDAGDGVRANDHVTVDRTYIHSMQNIYPDPHCDCIQRYSGAGRNLTFTRNYLVDEPLEGGGCIMIGNELNDIAGPLLIDANHFEGGNYSLYHDAPENISTVTNNHWGRLFHANCGAFGPANDARSPGTQSGNVFVPDLSPISL
jgi:hypothetical protein